MRSEVWLNNNLNQLLIYIYFHGEASLLVEARNHHLYLVSHSDDELTEEFRTKSLLHVVKRLLEDSPTGDLSDVPMRAKVIDGKIEYPKFM